MTDSSFDEKTKIKQLEKQLAQMMAKIETLTAKPERKTRAVSRRQPEVSAGIAPNTYVRVMSLVDNPLNLSTKPHGKGRTFSFQSFGDIKKMFYSELLEVIENHPNFFNAGYFYILDNRVIEENNWQEVYSKILTKEQMEAVYGNSNSAVSLFKTSNAKQQKVIAEWFIDQVVMGKPVDRNLIAEISEISGVDIMERAKGMVDPDKK